MSFDALFAAVDCYAAAVSVERSATEELDKRRTERDAAERVAFTAAKACDEARNNLWEQVEALSGKRAELWKILEFRQGSKPTNPETKLAS